MRDVTKNAPQQAVKNLGRAYANFFDDLARYRRGELIRKRVRVPTFKKKRRRDSLRAENGPDASHENAVPIAGKAVTLTGHRLACDARRGSFRRSNSLGHGVASCRSVVCHLRSVSA